MPIILKKRNRTIAKVKSNYLLKNHKFAIKVPKNTKESIDLDRENGNILWWDAVCQDMKNVCPAFDPW